jgi:hypothetical protein
MLQFRLRGRRRSGTRHLIPCRTFLLFDLFFRSNFCSVSCNHLHILYYFFMRSGWCTRISLSEHMIRRYPPSPNVVRFFIVESSFIRPTEHLTVDMSFVLGHGEGQVGQSAQPVTLYLSITVSATSISAHIPQNIPTEVEGTSAEEGHQPTTTSTDSRGPEQSMELVHPLPPPDHLPVQGGTPMPQEQGEAPLVKEAQIGLDRVDEAKKLIDRSDTWEGVVGRIKWLMDTLSPVAGVRAIFVFPFLAQLSRPPFPAQSDRTDRVQCGFSDPSGAPHCVVIGNIYLF